MIRWSSREKSNNTELTFRKVKFKYSEEGADDVKKPEVTSTEESSTREDLADKSRYWHSNSPFISYFWSALSTVFPAGEQYFMDSIRQFKDEIADPALKNKIDVFCRQEAHHTHQHKLFDKHMEELGMHEVLKNEDRTYRDLARLWKYSSREARLAFTLAAEHFTALIAHQILTNPKALEGVDPKIKALWEWHAMEEVEHKAVAFDIYNAIGGSYFVRISMLLVTWFFLLMGNIGVTFYLMIKSKEKITFGDVFKGLRHLFGFRGIVTGMIPAFLSYFRPGFHPWDHDNAYLIDQWYDNNKDYIVNAAS